MLARPVVCVSLIFLIVGFSSGCASEQSTASKPPPKYQKKPVVSTTRPPARRTTVPTGTGYKRNTTYIVKKGDTIWRIAQNFRVPPDVIVDMNHVRDVTDIKPGQRLIIPLGYSGSRGKHTGRGARTFNPPRSRSNESFIWPLRGEVLTDYEQWVYGYKNNGIDIKADNGRKVKASKSGIVALTSDTPDGWGKVVVLQHYDGSYTWYGYNSKVLVRKSDMVFQGQTIATAGSTGMAKQVKLHFKIFINNIPVNPLKYLPR